MTTVTGALGSLSVGPGTNYRVRYDPGFDPGHVTRRRQVATSAYVDGGFETASVRDRPFMSLQVDVKGTTQALIQTNVSALIAAVSASTYTVALTLDGTSWSWTCYAADYGIGFTQQMLIGLQCPVSLSIPRDPVPVSGPV